MSDARPVLVGMNNPYGQDPKYALYPAPEMSAGYRLYRMLYQAACRRRGASPGVLHLPRQRYLDAFDRRNVLSGPKWVQKAANAAGREMLPALAGRRVVVLGRGVATALGLPETPWCEGRCVIPAGEMHGVYWWTVPHPSGLCREYNDPRMVERVGDLLLALYEGETP